MRQDCKICNRNGGFSDLRAHLKAHKISWQEYLELYGEKPRSLTIIHKLPEKERMLRINIK